MRQDEDNVIGIVGGMGPQAGVALLNDILGQTGAATDQQHLSAILMSFPRHIPDRTAFLEGTEAVNPAFTVAQIIGKLEKAGAAVVGIACNTAHAPPIFDVVLAELARANSRVKLLNMPDETCRYLRENHPRVERVGVMATNGTHRSGLYRHLLRARGYEVVEPDEALQHEVIHRLIYHPQWGIKANPAAITRQAREMLGQALHFFRTQKADALVLGCTELSLALAPGAADGMPIIDSTRSLARALIREALGRQANENNPAGGADAAMTTIPKPLVYACQVPKSC